jgi:hypothetical protein
LYLGLLLVRRLFKILHRWIISRNKVIIKDSVLIRVVLALVLLTITLGIVFGAAGLMIRLASQTDFRFQLMIDQFSSANLQDLPSSETDIILLARGLAFLERTVYWY